MGHSMASAADADRRLFRDRQILLRAETGVTHIIVRRRHQMLAIGVVAGFLMWGLVSTIALALAATRIDDQASQIRDLEIGYAELITASARQGSPTVPQIDDGTGISARIVAENAALSVEIDRLHGAIDQQERLLATERSQIDDLIAQLGDLEQALAHADAEHDATLADRAEILARLEGETAERRRVAGERRALRSELDRLELSLAEANDWNGTLEGQIDRLALAVEEAYSIVDHIVGERDALHAGLSTADGEIAAVRNRVAQLEGWLRQSQLAMSELWRRRNRLIDENGALAADLDRASEALAAMTSERDEALTWLAAFQNTAGDLWVERNALLDRMGDSAVLGHTVARLEADNALLAQQLTDAQRAATTLVAERDALLDRTGTMTGRIESLESELALRTETQEAVFGALRERAAGHVDQVEAALAYTGLDIASLLDTVAAEVDDSVGGPMVPPVPERLLQESAWSDAVDLLALIDRAGLLQTVSDTLPLAMPVRDQYRISSGFGYRRDPFTGRTARHMGLDFAGSRGLAIFPGGPGEVVFAGWRGAYGNMVEIQHAFGLTTRYAHLTEIVVEVGDDVQNGDLIGYMGNTGRSTGPHLHYEVRVHDVPNNPMNFIRAGQSVLQITTDDS